MITAVPVKKWSINAKTNIQRDEIPFKFFYFAWSGLFINCHI